MFVDPRRQFPKGRIFREPVDDVFFDIFSEERDFIQTLVDGTRTAWATRDSVNEDVVYMCRKQGRYGTHGTLAMSSEAARLSDGLTSSISAGLMRGKLGTHGVGDHYIHGELEVDEFAHVLGPLTVEEATELMKSLLVKGSATFEADVTFKGPVEFDGSETHKGEADYTDGKIRVPSPQLIVDGVSAGVFAQNLVTGTIMGRVVSPDGLVVLQIVEPAQTEALQEEEVGTV